MGGIETGGGRVGPPAEGKPVVVDQIAGKLVADGVAIQACAISMPRAPGIFGKSEAKDYVHGLREPTQCPPHTVVRPVAEDEEYVDVTLRGLKILNARIRTKKFYGAVHSDIAPYHCSGQAVNFKSLITLEQLKGKDVDAAHLDRVHAFLDRLAASLVT